MQNSYCAQNDLHNSIKIPIQHICCNEYDSEQINPIKKKRYSNQNYNFYDIKKFPDIARKVKRSFFFYICTSFFNMKWYEPAVGHAFLNEKIVYLIEKPTCKHLANLIQICDMKIPNVFDATSVKKKIIDLLLISYELQQLTRPWDGVSSVAHRPQLGNVDIVSMFDTWAMIIPVGMELIETDGYKNGFVELYKNAKYGYKRSFCMWLSLGIISFFINKKCTIGLFSLYNICSAVYFYKKLNNAYDNVKKAINQFDLFAEKYNNTIRYERDLGLQHIISETSYNNRENNFLSYQQSFVQTTEDRPENSFFDNLYYHENEGLYQREDKCFI